MVFSEKLQFIRKNHGFTQEELAGKLNVSRQAVAKWEAGQSVPDILNCDALAKLYDVELLHRQALKLRTYIEDALYPYIALQDCLVVDMERIEDTPIIYNTITQKVYENGQWSKQDLDLHGKLLIYVKSSPPMPAATEQINNGF